jgi:mlo protein
LRDRQTDRNTGRGRGREIEMGLEQTTTWAVATVCTIFVVASLLVEAGINQLGKWLKRKNMKPLVHTLEKIKDGALMDHILLTLLFASLVAKLW